MNLEFTSRLNLLTGDNGLGKTFVLDVAWWALARKWADIKALPDPDYMEQPEIIFQFGDGLSPHPLKSVFSFEKQDWAAPRKGQSDPCAVMYIRADGGICIYDPLRSAQPFIFKVQDVWDGLKRGRKQLCNGLIDDWTSWQLRQDAKRENFDLLVDVLSALSPSRDERLVPGEPVRVSMDDSREIPTIRMPYGRVPVTHASSGCRRVLSIAYLLVWMRSENQEAAKIKKKRPMDKMIILFDEVESHLHPQWQRVLIPSLMTVQSRFDPSVNVQLIASTHAPLVLASIEPIFSIEEDSLTVFDLINGEVIVQRPFWRNFGDVSSWLKSEVFKLGEARSLEGEKAIQKAMAAVDRADMSPDVLKSIHEDLRAVLKDTDPFWPRWLYYADKKGVPL